MSWSAVRRAAGGGPRVEREERGEVQSEECDEGVACACEDGSMAWLVVGMQGYEGTDFWPSIVSKGGRGCSELGVVLKQRRACCQRD